MDIHIKGALHEPIAAFETENFDRLLHHPDVDINYRNVEGETLLMESIRKSFGAMAKRLIKAGCDVNAKGQCGYTPLHRAAENNLIDVARQLILRGAYIDKQAQHNYTPLNCAIAECNLDAVCLLLYYQADVNYTPTRSYGTPLTQALGFRMNIIAKVLLDFCDDITISYEDRFGATALTVAAHQLNPIAIDLVKKGASVNSTASGVLCDSIFYRDSKLFKLIFPECECTLCPNSAPFLYWYIDDCRFSNSVWLECFYFILNSPAASEFIREYEEYLQKYNYLGILSQIMGQLAHRNIKRKDIISIIYICLSLGAEIEADDLQLLYWLFGLNDEFEAVVYAGDLSYDDYKKQMCLLFKKPLEDVPADRYAELYYCDCKYKKVLQKRKVHLEQMAKIPQFPSLLELSRDQTHTFIGDYFKIVKAYQFYDAVKSLKLSPIIENIILFKQNIY